METPTRTKIQHTTECFICFCCSDDIGQPGSRPVTVLHVNYSNSMVIRAMGAGGRPDGRGVRTTEGQMVQVKVKHTLYRPGQVLSVLIG